MQGQSSRQTNAANDALSTNSSAAGIATRACLHCFRQCARSIHNTHTRKTSVEPSEQSAQIPGVRRQSAADGGHSPEWPPSAACCLPRTQPHRFGVTIAILPTGWRPLSHEAPQPFRFRFAGTSLPTSSRTGRDCLAAHRRSALERRRLCPSLRPIHRACFRTLPTEATLPRYGTSCRLDRASPIARYLMTNQAAGVPTPDAAVIPALASIFETEVTLLGRVTAQSARVCIAFRPTTLSCLTCAKQISPYESRSLGYRSRTDIRCSAPSPRNLTGKLFRSYSIEPFMVELFS